MSSTQRNQLPDSEEDLPSNEVETEEPEEDKILPLVRLYFKVGGYFKLSWKQFQETPWPVIKQCAMLLDEKEGDMNQFIGYEEASIFKNLRRMFPPKSD